MSDQSEIELQDIAPEANILPSDYVPVFDSPDYEAAEIVCATLASEGIHGVMQNPLPNPGSNELAPLGMTWSHAVYVPPDEVEAARAILNAPPPTDEELAAAQAADPTTIEEAEAAVKDA